MQWVILKKIKNKFSLIFTNALVIHRVPSINEVCRALEFNTNEPWPQRSSYVNANCIILITLCLLAQMGSLWNRKIKRSHGTYLTLFSYIFGNQRFRVTGGKIENRIFISVIAIKNVFACLLKTLLNTEQWRLGNIIQAQSAVEYVGQEAESFKDRQIYCLNIHGRGKGWERPL